MLKAFRYLKPFWLSVVAVVALVFGQVQLELALPDYMSNIVTYGIQYNGITENIPEAISQKTMDHLAYFMSDQDYKTVQKQRNSNGPNLDWHGEGIMLEATFLLPPQSLSCQNCLV